MLVEISLPQANIMLQLLEWHIENLIDEDEDSERGFECQESKKLYDLIYDAATTNK